MNRPLASFNNTELSLPTISLPTTGVRQNSSYFPFSFSGNLAGHPLFQIPRLVELVNLISSQDPSKVACVATGRGSVDCNWLGQTQQEHLSKAIAYIEQTDLLLLIQDVQEDPEYQALLERIVDELERLTKLPLRQQNIWIDAYVFITPSSSATKYHFNNNSSFLFQIHGAKKPLVELKKHSIFISLVSCPGEDRTVNLHLFALESSDLSNDIAGNKNIKKTNLSREFSVIIPLIQEPD